jgi:hypothetical protein
MGHVARIIEMRNAYKILFGELEGNRQFGRRRRRWKDNIKEIVCGNLYWIHMTQDIIQWQDLVNTIMDLRVL